MIIKAVGDVKQRRSDRILEQKKRQEQQQRAFMDRCIVAGEVQRLKRAAFAQERGHGQCTRSRALSCLGGGVDALTHSFNHSIPSPSDFLSLAPSHNTPSQL